MNTENISEKIRMIANQLIGVANAFDEIPTSFPKQAQALVDKNLCLICTQSLDNGKRVIRGCHENCYRTVSRMIQDGVTTEHDAVNGGYLLPPKAGGRKKATTIHDLIAQVRNELQLSTVDNGEEKKDETKTKASAKQKR